MFPTLQQQGLVACTLQLLFTEALKYHPKKSIPLIKRFSYFEKHLTQ